MNRVVTYTANELENGAPVVMKGVCTCVNDEYIDIKMRSGIVTLPLNEGSLEIGRKSRAKAKASASDVRRRKSRAAASAAARTPAIQALIAKCKNKGPTKKERALAIMKKNPGLARKEYIEMFMTEIGMTKAGAGTYYFNCKKALA